MLWLAPLLPVVITELVKILKLLVVTTLDVKALKELVVTTELVKLLNELVVTSDPVSKDCVGMLVRPLPSPTKLPVNDPVVYDAVNVLKAVNVV